MRKRIKRLDDLIKWRIEMLAKFGGFSHKYIASIVFDTTFGRVDKLKTQCISGFLSRQGIRLSNWRNGFSTQSQVYSKQISRPKKAKKRYSLVARKRKVA